MLSFRYRILGTSCIFVGIGVPLERSKTVNQFLILRSVYDHKARMLCISSNEHLPDDIDASQNRALIGIGLLKIRNGMLALRKNFPRVDVIKRRAI